MSEMTTKRCPYCAEEIQAEAVKCKHCGSILSGGGTLAHHLTQPWYRARTGRVIAGICMGLARQFNISVTLIRLAFVLATFMGGWGIIVYIALRFIMPLEPFVPQYDASGNPRGP